MAELYYKWHLCDVCWRSFIVWDLGISEMFWRNKSPKVLYFCWPQIASTQLIRLTTVAQWMWVYMVIHASTGKMFTTIWKQLTSHGLDLLTFQTSAWIIISAEFLLIIHIALIALSTFPWLQQKETDIPLSMP